MQESTNTVLEVQQLHHAYADNRVLKGVDLSLNCGQITAVLGPNGAGKTTLIQSLLGLTGASYEQLALLGQPLPPRAKSLKRFASAPRPTALRERIGVMMQVGQVAANLTVIEQLRLFQGYYQQPKGITELLAISGLQEQAEQRFGRLSGGQKQRLMFALALVGDPQLLFLDEPTIGLDTHARQRFWQVIRDCRAAGTAILLTSHYLDEVEQLADRVVVLQQGRIIADAAPEQLAPQFGRYRISANSGLTVQQIQQLPAVVQVQQAHNGRWQVTSADSTASLRQWLHDDPQLAHIEVQRASLEQVFLQLTGATHHAQM